MCFYIIRKEDVYENKYRTIYCGEVSTKNIGEEIRVAGWLEQKEI